MSLLCIANGCRVLGVHTSDCETECVGCVPREPSAGLRLCDYHTRRIGEDASRCARLFVELELVLAAPERPGLHTSGTPDHGTLLNERAADMRQEIRAVLVSWCRLVAEERGIDLPMDTMSAIGNYLDTHRVWLAAHPAADDCSAELSALAHRAHSAAYPNGARVFPVGPCPTCGATLRAVLRQVDSLLPSEIVCDAEQPHHWPAHRWRELGRHRYLSSAEIMQRWKLPIGTVHRLASERGWRRTEDGRRPVLYFAEDVKATLDETPARVA